VKLDDTRFEEVVIKKKEDKKVVVEKSANNDKKPDLGKLDFVSVEYAAP